MRKVVMFFVVMIFATAEAETVYDSNLTMAQFHVASNVTENVVQSAGRISVNGGGEYVFVNGWEGGAFGRYAMSGGILDITLGNPKIGLRGVGLMDIGGGELWFESGYPAVGHAASGRGSVVARGEGLVTVLPTASRMVVGQSGRGMLSAVDGGTVRSSVEITLGNDASGIGQLNVANAGVLEASSVAIRNGSGSVNLGGGTVRPTAAGRYMVGLEPALQAGGVIFDIDDGKSVSLAARCQDGRLKSSNLAHRWSFNGNLRDSVGGHDATLATESGVVQGEKDITLLGGTSRETYIKLGSNVIPETEDGITLELWATHLSVQSWSRIFTACDATKGTYLFMTWDHGTDLTKDICRVACNGNYETAQNELAPWELGREFHIAVVCKNVNGRWNVTFYRQDVATGMTLKSATITAPDGFSPTLLNDQVNLGWSSLGDSDAHARYNEVRIWNIPLTEEELWLSGIMGADADLDADASLVKTSGGTLVLAGKQAYSGVTEVREGVLSLGGLESPVHRWSFEGGSLVDSVSGTSAVRYGSNASGIAATADGHAIALPGGLQGTAYLSLGSGLLPMDGKGFTIEIWATLEEAVPWSRIFTLHAGNNEFAFMTWQGTDANTDIVGIRTSGTDYNVARTLSPWTVGTPYHIAYVCSSDGDGWRIDFYKQNAATGELEKRGSSTPPLGWCPACLSDAQFNLGWAPHDPDAKARYDEVRIWNRAFTRAEVMSSGLRGADRLPVLGQDEIPSGSLPSSTVLKVGFDANFTLCGAKQTVRAVEGTGTLNGPGTLTVSDAVRPGGSGTAGTLMLSGGLTLDAVVELDVFGDGTCDAIKFAAGVYDVSAIALKLSEAAQVDRSRKYVVAELGKEVTLVGDFNRAAIPDDLKLKVKKGNMVLSAKRGMVVILK